MNTTTLLVLCACVAISSAAYASYQKPFVRHTQYRTQDTYGQYNYGFDSDDGIKRTESRTQDGAVNGGYSYTSPEGQLINIQYTSGPQGFVASGNAIPQPPPLPLANIRATEEHLRALAAAPKTSSYNDYQSPQQYDYQSPQQYDYQEPQQNYGPPPYISYNYKFSS